MIDYVSPGDVGGGPDAYREWRRAVRVSDYLDPTDRRDVWTMARGVPRMGGLRRRLAVRRVEREFELAVKLGLLPVRSPGA